MSEKKIMNIDEVWDFIKPMKKRHWTDRHHLKSTKNVDDWSDVYVALCAVGLIRDYRYPEIQSLNRLLLAKDFEGVIGEWHLNRGQQQAFTYRNNRIQENAQRFKSRYTRNRNFGLNFKIDRFFPVKKTISYYSSMQIGWVVASDLEDATRISDLLYAPFYPQKSETDQTKITIDESEAVPVLYGNKSEYYNLMAKTAEKIRKSRKKLEDNIQEIEEQIKQNQMMEDCLNLNLCAFDQNEKN